MFLVFESLIENVFKSKNNEENTGIYGAGYTDDNFVVDVFK